MVAVSAFVGMVVLRNSLLDVRQQSVKLRNDVAAFEAQKVEFAALENAVATQEKRALTLEADRLGSRELIVALLSNQTRLADVVALDSANGAVGGLVWDGDQHRGRFVAKGLAPRAATETYELWANAGGRFVSLGTFDATALGFARLQVRVPEGISSYDSASVTIEPVSGTPAKEGPTVFVVVDLSRLEG